MYKNQISFGSMSDRLFSFVCQLYQPNERFPYPLQKGQKGSLLGTLFASLIAHMLNRVDQLPGREKICQELLNLRNPETGLFVDPDLQSNHLLKPEIHSMLYVTLQSTYFSYACLHALGVSVDRRVCWLSPLLEDGAVANWLNQLDWKNPWLVSNLDMFLGVFLLEWQSYDNTDECVEKAIAAYFNWHDEMQIPQTGFWGKQGDLLNAMAGGYHIYLHYDYCNRPIQYVKNIIDATLQLPCRDGLFVYGGGGGSCEDMDAIDILVRLSLRTSHREDEIRNVLLLASEKLSLGSNNDGGFSWRIQPTFGSFFSKLINLGGFKHSLSGDIYAMAYKIAHNSHYNSTHYYSSLLSYPYKISKSDMWSSWFRPLTLALVAKRYPEHFLSSCDWRLPYWPGLGYEVFRRSPSCPSNGNPKK